MMDPELTASGSDDCEGNMVPKENFNIEDPLSNAQKTNRSHRNILERKRKEKIKMYISQLKDMIPPDYLPSMKKPSTNNAVLEHAVAYMKHLKQQSELFFANNGSQVQTDEIFRLKSELEAVTTERDKYKKMVDEAAAVTPGMLANVVSSRQAHCNPTSEPHNRILTPPIQPTIVSCLQGPQLRTDSPTLPQSSQAKLPGQGLIITQSGQTYYVNEQGIPVAQGMAPSQLLSDALLPRSSAAGSPIQTVSQPTVTPIHTKAPATITTSASVTPISSASITTSVTLSSLSQQQVTATPATPVSNGTGLVAIPGHKGNLPSAIILPNGQIIPVVGNQVPSAVNTSGNNQVQSSTSSNSSLTTSVAVTAGSSTTAVPTTPNSTDLNMSTSANVVLIGSQNPPINNVVMGTHGQPPTPDPANQLGRKIMPKPTQFFTSSFPTMMAPITLTPLPIPACSISVGPPPFQTKSQPIEPDLVAKKKRPRKKKIKDPVNEIQNNYVPPTDIKIPTGPLPSPSNNSIPAPMNPPIPVIPGGLQCPPQPLSLIGQSESDILATATASLFSPKHSTDPLNLQASIGEGFPLQNPEFDPTRQSVTTIPLTGTRARRTRKRKNREAKLAEEREKVAKSSGTQNMIVGEDGLPATFPSTLPDTSLLDIDDETGSKKSRATSGSTETDDMPALSELTGEIPEQETTANNSQSIEFDPNDLDNILDQVENIDSHDKQSVHAADGLALTPESLQKPATSQSGAFQVLNGDEEIGPVFTTKPITPTAELINSGKPNDAIHRKPSTPYAASESYSIGNLTKTTVQPVDHRRQIASKSSSTNDPGVNIFDAYSKPASSFQPYSQNKPKQADTETPLSSSNETEDSGLPESTKDVNVAGLYKPRGEPKSPSTDKYDSNSPWSSYSNISVKRQNDNSSPMDWLSENKPPTGATQPKPASQNNKESHFNMPSDYSYAPYNTANQIKPINHVVDDHKEKQNIGFNRQNSMSQSSNPSPRSTASSGSAPAWSPARESEWNQTNKPSQLPKQNLVKTQQGVTHDQTAQSQTRIPADATSQPYQYNTFQTFDSVPAPTQHPGDNNDRNGHEKSYMPSGYHSVDNQNFSPAQSPQDLSNTNQAFNNPNLGYQSFSRQNSDSGVWQPNSFNSQHPQNTNQPKASTKSSSGIENEPSKIQQPHGSSLAHQQPPHNPSQSHQNTAHKNLPHPQHNMTRQQQNVPQPHQDLSHEQQDLSHPQRKQSQPEPKMQSKPQPRVDLGTQKQNEKHSHQQYQSHGYGLQPHQQQSNLVHTSQSIPQTQPAPPSHQSFNFQQQQHKPQQSQNKQPLHQQLQNRMQQAPNMQSSQLHERMQHSQQQHHHGQQATQRPQSQQPGVAYHRSNSNQMPDSPLNTNVSMQSSNDHNNQASTFNQTNPYYNLNPHNIPQPESQHNSDRCGSLENAATRPESRENSAIQHSIPGGRLGALLSLGSPQKAGKRVLQPPSNQTSQAMKLNNGFSAESLLSKGNVTKNQGLPHQFSQHINLPRASNPIHRPTAMNADFLQQLERDKTFRSTPANEPPFNVNLFASTAPNLASLKNSLPSSFGLTYNDPTFTFSLTGTSTGPPTSSVAGANFMGKHLSQQSLPLPVSQQQTHQSHDSLGTSRQPGQVSHRGSVDNNKTSQAQMHSQFHPVSSLDFGLSNPYQNKAEPANQPTHRTPSGQQQPPPLVKTSKRNNSTSKSAAKATDVAKEMTSLPYPLGQAPYGLPPGIPPFTMANTNTNPNLFAPQAMYNKSAAGSFGLPFQPPGFPPIPSTNQHNLMQQINSSQMNQAVPGFNINNLMKDKGATDPAAAFKLGASEQPSMPGYPPQPSHLYGNPMNINNLFSAVPGFDPNRPAMPGFPHTSPAGFPGFHPQFDLNLNNQP